MHATWLLKRMGRNLDEIYPAGAREIVEGERKFLWTPTLRDGAIETLLKIRGKTGKSRFELNKAQREYSRKCSKQNIVLKARQVGITTYIAARFFLQTITRAGTTTVQVAHNSDSAEEIFQIVKRYLTRLPAFPSNSALHTSYCNSRRIVFPTLDSEYRVAAADENAGRGWTINHLHCSEVSRWGKNAEEALAALRGAVVPEGEIVLESTPNGAGGLFYEEWQRAEETGYTRHFFPWWYGDEYVLPVVPTLYPLHPDELELMAKHGLTEAQIMWRRNQWSTLRGLAGQEYAEDAVACFRASGECVFEQVAVDTALRGLGEPIEMRDNHRVMVWLPPQAGREYVIGVDPAGGGSEGDYSCAQVIDRRLGTQCAELHGHYPPRELSQRLVELGKEYNRALIAVERNNHGYGVLAHLRMMDYPNVYAHKGQDGWLTSAVSRPVMIENLAEALVKEPMLFRSSRLLNECRTFVRYADGNTGAAQGTHDDCVMAMAIAWAVRAAEAGRSTRVHEVRKN